MTPELECPVCNHPKAKHAFDIAPPAGNNPCGLSCMVCFDLETQRIKQEKSNA